jgi:hypothetical protein
MGSIDRRLGRGVAIIAVAVQMAGCASFDGIPEPVLPVDEAVRIATGGSYGATAALTVAESTKADDEKRRYRDAFVAIQLAATDARYMDFRAKLSRQMKGANFGLELGILGLTGVGAIAASQRAANVLSSAASGLTGSKSALSKEVYFEKALPALIASMDARRLTEKTKILEKMRSKGIADYSIQEAMIDLSAYQTIASLDGAIEQVTTDAAAQKADAQARYDAVVQTCTAEAGVGPIWGDIVAGLDTMTAAEEADLDTMSTIVGTPTSPPFDDQRDALITAIGQKYCTVAAATTLLATFKLKTGVQFP